MTQLSVPLTVRTRHGPVDLVLEAAGPLPWHRAQPEVLRVLGLPPGTPLYLGVGRVEPDWPVGSPPLLAGVVLDVDPADDLPGVPPVVLAVISGPDAGRWLPLAGGPLVVGRDPGGDLTLTDPQVSFRHALLRPTPTGIAITDLGSTNGVRVDGQPVGAAGTSGDGHAVPERQRSIVADGPAAEPVATTGSLIRIGGTLLQVQLTVEPPGRTTPDGAGHLVRSAAPPGPARHRPRVAPDPGPAPERRHRPLPVLAAVLGAAVGGTLALILGSSIYLAFAALGPVTMIGSALSDRIAGRRSHRRRVAEHRAAVGTRERAIRDAVRAERRRAWELWPDPATLLRRATAGGARLWDRRPGDEGYLRLAVGAGTRQLWPDGTGPEAPAATGVLTPEAAAVTGIPVAGPLPVSDAPVTIDLPAVGVIGLIGAAGRALARWWVAQIAALHSPTDVTVLLVDAGEDLLACRDLPHVAGPAETAAGDDRADAGGPRRIGDLSGAATADTVVLLDGARAIRSPLGRATMAAAGGRSTVDPVGTDDDIRAPRRISALCLVHEPSQLPAECSAGVSLGSTGTGRTVAGDAPAAPGRPGSTGIDPADPARSVEAPVRIVVPGAPGNGFDGVGPIDATGIDSDQLARVCRALAPLRDGDPRARSVLPGSVRLTDLIGPVGPEELTRRWRRPSIRAVIGAGTSGIVTFDLDADGPHLLIAGTTGAGKSELLQTLVAALAIAAPPRHLTFLLVDYKGGAAFGAVAGLPHVVGVVTDLDPALSARALASLRAELRRRERLAARADPEPPRLVVVVDEFATLAAELPQFLAGMLDVAQRGRALGLHLVLATQRPAGVVSPAMRSNISTRICLRVTDVTDSLDVIGVPDAARISPRTPGRAVLRTGSELVAFQTALVTVPSAPDLRVRRRDPWSATLGDPRVAGRTRGHAADGAGAAAGETRADASHAAGTGPAGQGDDAPVTAHPPAGHARGADSAGDAPSILRVLVDAARTATRDRTPPNRPWLPPLPTRFCPGDEEPGALALADRPDRQARAVLALPATSVLVTGPAGSGRSTALRRIAIIAAGRGAELLVVDAAESLSDLRDWPAVSSHLGLDQPRLVMRLLALLADPDRRPVDDRERWLIVDGYDLAAAALDRADYLTGAGALTEISARTGGAVRLAAAGPPSLQHQRLAAGFPTVIALHGGDAAPGRGTWSGDDVQIADAPVGSVPLGTADGSTAWPDALVVRPLPDLVPRSALPAPRAEAVPIGMGGDAGAAVTVDLRRSSGAIVVAGPRRAGVSTALAVLADGAVAAGIPVLGIFSGPPLGPVTPGLTMLDLRGGDEPLHAALAAHTGPLLLVSDRPNTGAGHQGADLLERFCQVCRPGQHLLLGERLDVLARAHHGHLAAALAFRRGLLLAPDAGDGTLLDVTLPRRSGPLPPGRGVWADGGVATPVQVAGPV